MQTNVISSLERLLTLMLPNDRDKSIEMQSQRIIQYQIQICYAQLRISKLYYNPRGRGIVRFAMCATLKVTNP